MMRSLYSAVSGLQNHQTRMDVIGNNVANVNTTGFKKGRVTFQDILSQSVSGAAKPTDERGGLNPKQVGLGMNIASIDTIMSQGGIQTTGKNTDLAITGEGFFVVKTGDQQFMTRAGNFLLDREGTLVNPNGMKVQGWMATQPETGEPYINTSAPLTDLTIPIGGKLEARQTEMVFFKSNLDARTPFIADFMNATEQEQQQNSRTVSYDIYDKYGNPHQLQVNFRRTENLNEWIATVNVVPQEGETLANLRVSVGAAKDGTGSQFLMRFDPNNAGTLQSITEINPTAGVPVQTDAEGSLNAFVRYDLPDGSTHEFQLNLGTVGSIKNSITQFSQQSSTHIFDQDGYKMGYLQAFKIDESGTITGSYDNGEKRTLGQLATATFVNPMGLEKVGESLYVETNNSGTSSIGEPGTLDRGKIYTGALEMSNVDLSETFTDMIITERGFQANSRVVTTSDDMLREILQLKR